MQLGRMRSGHLSSQKDLSHVLYSVTCSFWEAVLHFVSTLLSAGDSCGDMNGYLAPRVCASLRPESNRDVLGPHRASLGFGNALPLGLDKEGLQEP